MSELRKLMLRMLLSTIIIGFCLWPFWLWLGGAHELLPLTGVPSWIGVAAMGIVQGAFLILALFVLILLWTRIGAMLAPQRGGG